MAAAMLASTGCGGQSDGKAPPVRPPGRPETASPRVVSTIETPGSDDQDVRVAAPPASQASVIATRFARAWARPDTPPAVWWAEIAPLCEPTFAGTLQTVDPAMIPATTVTGAPTATTPSSSTLRVFLIPTDAGTLTVTVVATAGAWMVSDNDFDRQVTR